MKNGINMRVVIIGCGLIGQKRANSLGSSTLVACCDIDQKAAKKFSINNNIPYYLDIEKVFENEDFEIAILSSTHNSLPGLIKKCLENKKHVLVEKPAGRFSHELEDLNNLDRNNSINLEHVEPVKNDDILDKLDSMTFKELKIVAKNLGIKIKGTKDELTTKIREHFNK